MTAETHYTTAHKLRAWGAATVAVAALLAIYSVVQLYRENVDLRGQLAGYKARGCPAALYGRTFTFSAYEEVAISRPRYARLNCFYAKGVQS